MVKNFDRNQFLPFQDGQRVTLMMQPGPVAVSCEDDEPNQLTIIFLANIAGSVQKSKNTNPLFTNII